MKLPHIIAITGPIGAGKSTLADAVRTILEERHFLVSILPFAAPVKEFARALGWNGEKDEKGRKLLQLLGTDIGRDCIGEHIWVDRWRKALGEAAADVVIADDLRFPNEAEAVHAMGGFVVRIVRANEPPPPADHASETQTIPYDIELPVATGQAYIRAAANQLLFLLPA